MTPSLSSFEYSLSPPNDLYQESRSFCIGCTKRGSGRGGGDIESGGAKDQEQKNGELARTCSGAAPPVPPPPTTPRSTPPRHHSLALFHFLSRRTGGGAACRVHTPGDC